MKKYQLSMKNNTLIDILNISNISRNFPAKPMDEPWTNSDAKRGQLSVWVRLDSFGFYSLSLEAFE